MLRTMLRAAAAPLALLQAAAVMLCMLHAAAILLGWLLHAISTCSLLAWHRC